MIAQPSPEAVELVANVGRTNGVLAVAQWQEIDATPEQTNADDAEEALLQYITTLEADRERLNWLASITSDVDQLFCPPGNHGGEITNWLLTHEGSTTPYAYKSWEAPTLREVIDAARTREVSA